MTHVVPYVVRDKWAGEVAANLRQCRAAAARGAYARNTKRPLHTEVATVTAMCNNVGVACLFETQAVKLAFPTALSVKLSGL